MKTILMLSMLLFAAAGLPCHGMKKPNVILILMDDLGYSDLSLTGSRFYETPHIDRLAKQGAFFSDAYAASPVCSPTRASILTGKYPSRIGLTNHSGNTGPKGPGYRLNAPEPAGNIPLDDVTLAEALKQGGYATAHIGKWHLQRHNEKGRAHFPEANGFDVNIAGHNMGQPGSYYFPYTSQQHPNTNVPDMEDGKEGDYLTDALTDKAIRFIEQHRRKPFFLNLWYYTVHTPIHPRQDKLNKYRAKAKEMGLDKTRNQVVPEYNSFSQTHQNNPDYAAMVESMDENIGRILKALDDLRLAQDTMVIFFSDNGGLSTGAGKGMPTSNLPLRAGKGWVYEGGIREPLIIRYPRKVRPGLIIEEPVVSTDLYPTILELAGLSARPEQHVDGLSLAPLMRRAARALKREALYFHYPHYHHINSMGPAGAVRMGHFKLVQAYETGNVELYNLRDDIGEQQDVSQKMPNRTKHMTGMLHSWIKKTGSLLPTSNPQFAGEKVQEAEKNTMKPTPVAPPQHPQPLNLQRKGKGPHIENQAIQISCRVSPSKEPNGVLVSQGGKTSGYALYVRDGKLHFIIRNQQGPTSISSDLPVPTVPFDVEAKLTETGEMTLRIDGVLVGQADSVALLSMQPVVGYAIGFDFYAPVGPYDLPFAYAGEIHDVVVNGKPLGGML